MKDNKKNILVKKPKFNTQLWIILLISSFIYLAYGLFNNNPITIDYNRFKKMITSHDVSKIIVVKNKEIIEVKGFYGCFVRRKDLYALKKSCIPYTGKEKLNKTEGFTFDWHILRVVKRAANKKQNDI